MASRTSAGVYKRGRNKLVVKNSCQVEGLGGGGALCVIFSNSDSTSDYIDTCDTSPEDIVSALENGNTVFGKYINSDEEAPGRAVFNVSDYDFRNLNVSFMTVYQSGPSAVKHRIVVVSKSNGVSQTIV